MVKMIGAFRQITVFFFFLFGLAGFIFSDFVYTQEKVETINEETKEEPIQPEKEKKQKLKNRKNNYSPVHFKGRPHFDQNELLNKTYTLFLPKSELPFELLRVTDLQKGIAAAKDRALKKALGSDWMNGPRPQRLYNPYLSGMDINLTINGNLGTDRIALIFYYDFRKDAQGKLHQVPMQEEIEAAGEKIFLIKFDGSTEPVDTFDEALKLLTSQNIEYYSIGSIPDTQNVPTNVGRIKQSTYLGWDVTKNLGKMKISVPNSRSVIGFSLFAKSKISKQEQEDESNFGKPYIKGTKINYRISKIVYNIVVPGMMGNPNTNWQSKVTYDPKKDLEIPYNASGVGDGENFIQFNPYGDKPLGVIPKDFEMDEILTELRLELDEQKQEIISALEEEKKEMLRLQQLRQKLESEQEELQKMKSQLEFLPDLENPLYKGTALVLDLSGSMSGTAGDILKTAAINALNKLPRDKHFALLYQIMGTVKIIAFDENLNWDQNVEQMRIKINKLDVGGGDSQILAPLLALHNLEKYPQLKNLSHVYVVTDGYLWEYDEFNAAYGKLNATELEINILQVGENYKKSASKKLQQVSKEQREEKKQIALLQNSIDQLQNALDAREEGAETITVMNQEGQEKIFKIAQAESMINQWKSKINKHQSKINSMKSVYDDEMQDMVSQRKNHSEFLNSLADLSGGNRISVGDLDEAERKRQKAEMKYAEHVNTIRSIEKELEKRNMPDFDANYITSLQSEIETLKNEIKGKPRATKLTEHRNKEIQAKLDRLKQKEKELKRAVKDWRKEVRQSGRPKDEIEYVNRVYLNKYKSFEEIE